MYKIYIYEDGYLKLIERNIPEEQLETYGDFEDKIYDGYKENDPKHIGYKLSKQTGKGFTKVQILYYAMKEVS